MAAKVGADYEMRMGYYATNNADCVNFSPAILSIFYLVLEEETHFGASQNINWTSKVNI